MENAVTVFRDNKNTQHSEGKFAQTCHSLRTHHLIVVGYEGEGSAMMLDWKPKDNWAPIPATDVVKIGRKKMFKFAQFDPRPQGADVNNGIIATAADGRNLLGIEVTIPALAAKCILGNLDHHGRGDTADTPSAVEQAMTAQLPSDGATLATVRADADSVSAMAVLASRFDGKEIDANLVSMLGEMDRLGPKVGRRDDRVLAIARKACDFKSTLEARVAWVQAVLARTYDKGEVATLVAARDIEFAQAKAASEVSLHADGRIAVVVSKHRFATNLGYEEASVVVAFNPEMEVDFKDVSKGTYRKFTVCRFDDHVACDLPSALAELQVLESGWGGRGDIFGSPQGVSSQLTIDQVVEVVAKHLK